MRYDLLSMLPERAFQKIGGRMTLEGGGGGKTPQMPAAPEPVQPPQEPKQPKRDPMASANRQTAITGGPSSTMITGPSGVAPSSVSLGRNVLYDSEKDKLGA